MPLLKLSLPRTTSSRRAAFLLQRLPSIPGGRSRGGNASPPRSTWTASPPRDPTCLTAGQSCLSVCLSLCVSHTIVNISVLSVCLIHFRRLWPVLNSSSPFVHFFSRLLMFSLVERLDEKQTVTVHIKVTSEVATIMTSCNIKQIIRGFSISFYLTIIY